MAMIIFILIKQGNRMIADCLVLSRDDSAEHRIEIRIRQGDEQKEFAIVAFGYCDNCLPSLDTDDKINHNSVRIKSDFHTTKVRCVKLVWRK